MYQVNIYRIQKLFLRISFGLGLGLGGLLTASASHHIDCTDPLNASHSECAGFIDCNDPINLIYPQCQGGATPTPTPEPMAPTALFNLTPESGEAPLSVNVNAAASSDSDGQITAYEWEISDGRNATGQTQSWTFDSAGTYTITLTVHDNQGLSASSSKTVTVAATQVSSADCMPIYDALESQLTLTWVNLYNGQNIVAQYADVVMQVLSNSDNGLQFQVMAAQTGDVTQAPSLTDCISDYDPDNGLLTIPAVKTSQSATEATYKNIRMNLLVPTDLIFKLESVETN